MGFEPGPLLWLAVTLTTRLHLFFKCCLKKNMFQIHPVDGAVMCYSPILVFFFPLHFFFSLRKVITMLFSILFDEHCFEAASREKKKQKNTRIIPHFSDGSKTRLSRTSESSLQKRYCSRVAPEEAFVLCFSTLIKFFCSVWRFSDFSQ